jgi:hypothetical protein
VVVWPAKASRTGSAPSRSFMMSDALSRGDKANDHAGLKAASRKQADGTISMDLT